MKGVPIYEYECQRCQNRFEVMQKFSDRPVKKCSRCGGPVNKVLSAPGLVFKGSGWYVTDYASSERKKAMKADSDGGGTNGDKKTDTADTQATTTASKTDD
jgi:putative FmdB family regulatory protein